MHSRRLIIPIMALAALVFLGKLGSRDIVTSHEARVAQTAREMAATGWPWNARPVAVPPSRLQDTDMGLRLRPQWDEPPIQVNAWWVPVLNGEIRLQKPPVPYWCAAIMYRCVGFAQQVIRHLFPNWYWGKSDVAVTPLVARLAPALLGVLATLVIYDLARMLIGRRGAWAAALVWVSSWFIVDEFRKAMADPYLTFFMLAALWAWVRASVGWVYSPTVSNSRWASTPTLLLFYASVGMGIMVKGPVVLLVVVPIVAWHWCYRRPAVGGWGHLAGVALLLAIVLPWPLYVVTHVPNALLLWKYESVGELTGENVEKARGWWFYLPIILQLSLPWTGLWLGGWGWALLRRSAVPRVRRRALFPAIWFGVVIVFFSFSAVKKAAYLLPVMPAQALLVAQAMVRLRAWARARRLPRAVVAAAQPTAGPAPVAAYSSLPPVASRPPLRDERLPGRLLTIQSVVAIVLGVVVAIAVLLRPTTRAFAEWRQQVYEVIAHGVQTLTLAEAVGGAIALIIGIWAARGRRRSMAGRLVWLGVAYGVLFFIFYGGYENTLNNGRSPRRFDHEVLWEASQPGCTLSRVGMQEAALFYLPADLKYDPSARRVFVILEDRGKRGGLKLEPAAFAQYAPGRKITRVIEKHVSTESDRNRWRLYRLDVE